MKLSLDAKKLLEIICWILIFGLAALFAYLSQVTYFANSEIWSASSAKFLFMDDVTMRGAFYKPLFNFILALNYFVHKTSYETYLGARILFVLFAIATLFLQYKIAREAFKCRIWALVPVLVTLSSYLYLSRGYRIRSDILASFITMFYMYFLVSGRYKKLTQTAKNITVIIFTIAIFATTPKSIFLFLAAIVFSYVGGFINPYQIYRKSIKTKGFLVFVLALVGMVYFIVSSPQRMLFFLEPLMYFIRTFQGVEQGSVEYFSPISFMHFRKALSTNSWLFFVLYFGWVVSLLPSLKKKMRPKDWTFAWYPMTFILIVTFVLIPDKYPFYLASMVPFFALAISNSLYLLKKNLVEKYNKKGFQIFAIISLTSVIIVCVQDVRSLKKFFLGNSNQTQILELKKLSKYFHSVEGATIYTGMGLFPKEGDVMVFLGPA